VPIYILVFTVSQEQTKGLCFRLTTPRIDKGSTKKLRADLKYDVPNADTNKQYTGVPIVNTQTQTI